MDLGHTVGSGPCTGAMPRTLGLGFISNLWNDRCFHVFNSLLTSNGYNKNSRFKILFSYENKLKKQFLLTTTNEIKVHLDSTRMPLIKKKKAKPKTFSQKSDDSLESKMAIIRV